MNKVGKIDDGKEFQRTVLAVKKEATQREILGFCLLTQNLRESREPLVLRERSNREGKREVNSLEYLQL